MTDIWVAYDQHMTGICMALQTNPIDTFTTHLYLYLCMGWYVRWNMLLGHLAPSHRRDNRSDRVRVAHHAQTVPNSKKYYGLQAPTVCQIAMQTKGVWCPMCPKANQRSRLYCSTIGHMLPVHAQCVTLRHAHYDSNCHAWHMPCICAAYARMTNIFFWHSFAKYKHLSLYAVYLLCGI